LRVALAFGPKGFEVDAIASSVVMITMTAVWVLAFARVTMKGGTAEGFFARAGFDGAVGAPGSVETGARTFCASAAVTVIRAVTAAIVEKRIGLGLPVGLPCRKRLSHRGRT